MNESRVGTGAIILVVLNATGVGGSLLLPVPAAEAPPWAAAFGVITGLIPLAALALWWPARRVGGRRAALWVAVVVSALSALLPVLGLGDPIPLWMKATTVAVLLLTALGVAWVGPALVRRRVAA